MSPDRPPDLDAEFRVVRGAFPRWALQLGLIKLMLWSAAVSGALIVLALCLLAAMGAFR
jgi:hypothetical protein